MNIQGKLLLFVGGMILLLSAIGFGGYWGTSQVAQEITTLDHWGNVDMVMNEEVIAPVIRFTGAIELYHARATSESLKNCQDAFEAVKSGLKEWTGLVAINGDLSRIAADISSRLDIYSNQLQKLSDLAEQRETFSKQYQKFDNQLDSKLIHAMDTFVDPAKEKAINSGYLTELAYWGSVDMAMNEEVIANLYKLRAVFNVYLLSGEESDFQALRQHLDQFVGGIGDWSKLLQPQSEMAMVSQEAKTVAESIGGIISSLRENHQLGQEAKALTQKLSHEILSQLTMAMEEIIDPGKEQAMASAGATKNQVLWQLIVGITVSLLIAGGTGVILARGISVPLKKAVTMLNEMERGHVDMRLNLNQRADEIGTMAATMDRFADSLQGEIIDVLTRLANGDLTFSVLPRDEQDQLRGALKKMGDDLNNTFADIQTVAAQLDGGACQVSDTSQSIAQGTAEQAASLEEISASMNQISAQAQQNAAGATSANDLSSQVMSSAEHGTEEMHRMVEAMHSIDNASRDISKIIKTIDEIAFQTNLLALNAAVEAARAGQHGKGFAVVAEEVRNLAARSAKAAQETTQLIEASVTKAANGTQIAEDTEKSLEEIVKGVTTFNELVTEIAAAANEQVLGIQQINQGLGQIDQAVQQGTANSEESAAAAEELSSQATQLRNLLAQFKLREELIGNPLRERIAYSQRSLAYVNP